MECCLHKSACRVRLYSGASWISSRHLPHWHDLALAALGQRAHMVAPQSQRRFDFAFVGTAVVNARRTSLVATVMVQKLLDDVRLHPEVGHAGRARSAKVMQRPWLDLIAEPRIKRRFGACPAGKPSIRAITEQGIAAYHARNARDDVQRER